MEFDPGRLQRDSWMFYGNKPINFPIPEGVTGPIHVLGDSHVNVLVGALPRIFISTQYAPIAAYADEDNRQHESIETLLARIPAGDKVLCCFGELYCRHYAAKFAKEQNVTIESLASTTVQRYIDNFLTFLQKKYKVIVLSIFVCPDDLNHFENAYEDIFKAKRTFNAQLEKGCEEHGLLFVPLFKEAFKNDWHLAPQGTYFNDSSHLGPCMIPLILNTIKNWKEQGHDI